MSDKNIALAKRIASAVSDAGGRTFYVGGFVRDQILKKENKDIDIEVHGISAHRLEQILDGLGERLMMGASFGIMGLRHYEIDIAMPRSEKTIGLVHKEFDISVDPFIGYKKAALRRDFTINALMQDVLTGEILDYFGGVEDLRSGHIRHVSDKTFTEDPLRVFRAAQFAARFDFIVDEKTIALAAAIDVSALSCERILAELGKALLKARKPSVFFNNLRKMNQLSYWFPEVEALIGIQQDPTHHPEGDVWEHTMQVIDQAALMRENAAHPMWFMLSALCHDFGKIDTTTMENGRIHAYGHEKAGLLHAKSFLQRITSEAKLHDYVLNMTELHMEPNQKVRRGSHKKSFMKMFDRSFCPEDLLLLARADSLGRQDTEKSGEFLFEEYVKSEIVLQSMLAAYHELMNQPYLMGRDLIDAGIEPGPWMGEALEYAHKLRLAGVSKDLQLRQTLAYIRKRMFEANH